MSLRAFLGSLLVLYTIIESATSSALKSKPVNGLYDILSFHPPILSLDRKLSGQEFSVHLNRAPKYPVTVSFGSPDIANLDRCQLTFTPSNYSLPQKVLAFAAGSFVSTQKHTGEKHGNISVLLTSSGLQANASYSVQSVYGESRKCVSSGDPHFSTFDGQRHNFQGISGNVYYLLKSPRAIVMARQTNNCTSHRGLTCNQAVAVRLKDGVVVAEIGNDAIIVKQYGKSGHVHVQYQTPLSITITTSDDLTVSVTASSKSMTHINIILNVPAIYSGETSGLCGSFSGTEKEAGGAANLVPGDKNLFICHNKCKMDVPANTPVGGKCIIIPPMPVPRHTKSSALPKKPVVTQTKVTDIKINPAILPTNKPKDRCAGYCKRIFGKLKCFKLDTKYYQDSCTSDCKILGKDKMKAIAEDMMNTFQRQCGIQIRLLLKSKKRKDRRTANKLMRKYNIKVEKKTEKLVVSSGKVVAANAEPIKVAPSSGMFFLFV
jgi:hypothetical protein